MGQTSLEIGEKGKYAILDTAEGIVSYLPERLRKAVSNIGSDFLKQMEELRIRAKQPLMGVFCGGDRFVGKNGALSQLADEALMVTSDELNAVFYALCEHSVYAYQDEIQRGYITLKGGHRAGICGTVVYKNGDISGVRDISSISMRIARELIGCAGAVFSHIVRNSHDIYNTLVISPPRCGKTTLLRDLSRLISSGLPGRAFSGLRTGIIDERSEIASSFRGVPQNDVGPRADVLDGCRKSHGIEILLRGMSPAVIIVDELGDQKDADSIQMAWNAGVRIIATAHAYSIEDLKGRLGIGQLAVKEGFERYIVLGLTNGKRWIRVMDTYGNELFVDHQADRLPDGLFGIDGHRNETVGAAERQTPYAYKV